MALLIALLVVGCALPLSNQSPAPGTSNEGRLSLEDRYAGEVLAYMMRVVLGRAGELAYQKAWGRQGLGQPLDLKWIAATMDHPERPKSDLMVMDAGLVGLSEILYDYNPRLNLFKGRYAFHSPYPSAELIALRLLLLGKLDRGETLRLSALIHNEAELISQGAALPTRLLEEMGLNTDEAALLQSVFRSEPAFRWYYKSPPLVAAMDAMGLLAAEGIVSHKTRQHTYAPWHKADETSGDHVVRVAVLPSLVPGYRSADGRLQPPEGYLKTVRVLRAAIRLAVDRKLVERTGASANSRLEVQLYMDRPFVLHPLNTGHHLAHLCPNADLVVIVLGRNVYRSITLAPRKQGAPGPPLWYLDLLDLKYGQTTAEIDEIAAAAVARLQALDEGLSARQVEGGAYSNSDKASENTL